jgi:hypothetical protein
MKFSFSSALFLGALALNMNCFAQLPKLSKPKINVSVPGVKSDVKASDVGLGGKDPSGLFRNVTNDNNAEFHRKSAVTNLAAIEAEFAKTSVDYEVLTKLIFENERSLGHIMKLEPKIDRAKYDEKYTPLKEKADKQNAAYAEAQKLESAFQKDFNAPVEFKKPDPMTFRTDGYGSHTQCYCRNYRSDVKTLAEYETAKKQYEALTAQLVGYSNAETQTLFANMATCMTNGNNYALWASKENLEKAITEYSKTTKPAEPKKVITRCDDYLAALGRIESDNSLKLDAATIAALTQAKSTVTKTKADAELYISSGQHKTYMDKMHAAEIAKVFLPKAATKNATLEAGAMNYVKGTDYNDYLKGRSDSQVASTMRAVTTTASTYIKKNEYGLPLYEYHEIWVAFKGKDGNCYMCAVYASYTYKGGGVYSTTPTWGADAPEEMACDNVMK